MKIVLMCNQGMSTSILMKKMKEAAASEGMACDISACPVDLARDKAADADIILLGPQVRFQQGNIQKIFPDKVVEVVDMRLYGRMDGKAILAFAKEKVNA